MKYDRWDISEHIIYETALAFTMGRHEVFALWTGPLRLSDCVCKIQRCIIPVQRPGTSWGGVYVHIDGTELSRVQFANYDRQERSVIQLHTHPSSDVSMSVLDKEWEVIKHIGALSIIVPNYGAKGLLGFPGVNVYEREESGWRLWSTREVERRLRVIK